MPHIPEVRQAGLDICFLENSNEASPVDLDHAIRAAAIRLHEGSPELSRNLAMADLEGELATFLCAFGIIDDEVDRMHAFKSPTCTPH
jgi:hypothetical protein